MIDQKQELCKCAEDFSYFCQNYIKINICRNGMQEEIPFKLYAFQEKLVRHWESNQFSIGSKFRHGGFTTLAAIYCLWVCLFRLDQMVIFYVSNKQNSSYIGDRIIKFALTNLPDWIKGNVLKMTNSLHKKFDTGSELCIAVTSGTLGSGRSGNGGNISNSFITLAIIDDAAYISDMGKNWANLYSALSGGRAIVQSTPNYIDDWFWERIIDSRVGIGLMKEFRCHYKDHPEFDERWEIQMGQAMGISVSSATWKNQYEHKPLEEDSPVISSMGLRLSPSRVKWRSIFEEWETN